MKDSELIESVCNEVRLLELRIKALRLKIEQHLDDKSQKDEVEQAFDECEKSDDEAA